MLAKKKIMGDALVLHCGVGSFGNQTRAMEYQNVLPAAFRCICLSMRRQSSSREKIPFLCQGEGGLRTGPKLTALCFFFFRIVLVR